MDKRVIINCIIIILIWICNRMAYYYLSGNTSKEWSYRYYDTYICGICID